MLKRTDESSNDTLAWLLEADSPGVRYLALRDLLSCSAGDAELKTARTAAHRNGPIATVVSAMDPDGYWVTPGAGYGPKYTSTVWSIILLAQLGASVAEDERIARACGYVLAHSQAPGGQFTASGAPSGTADCLQGNLCWALRTLGCDDSKLGRAYDWMAHTVTGEGIAPVTERDAPVRYYAGKCGPLFACGANDKLPCAWGAAKVMMAFSCLPPECRTPQIARAIEPGVAFLLGIDPVTAGWPSGWTGKPSRNWWKFGFPVYYVTDLLQVAEALTGLGYGADPRLTGLLECIRSKQDKQGRWALEYGYEGKTWDDYGTVRQPNKWVTLRALRVLQ